MLASSAFSEPRGAWARARGGGEATGPRPRGRDLPASAVWGRILSRRPPRGTDPAPAGSGASTPHIPLWSGAGHSGGHEARGARGLPPTEASRGGRTPWSALCVRRRSAASPAPLRLCRARGQAQGSGQVPSAMGGGRSPAPWSADGASLSHAARAPGPLSRTDGSAPASQVARHGFTVTSAQGLWGASQTRASGVLLRAPRSCSGFALSSH